MTNFTCTFNLSRTEFPETLVMDTWLDTKLLVHGILYKVRVRFQKSHSLGYNQACRMQLLISHELFSNRCEVDCLRDHGHDKTVDIFRWGALFLNKSTKLHTALPLEYKRSKKQSLVCSPTPTPFPGVSHQALKKVKNKGDIFSIVTWSLSLFFSMCSNWCRKHRRPSQESMAPKDSPSSSPSSNERGRPVCFITWITGWRLCFWLVSCQSTSPS